VVAAKRRIHHWRRVGLEYLTIGLGGSVGALARFGIDRAIPVAGTEFPWATFAANVSGSLILGFAIAVLQARRAPALLRMFLTIGVLSSYTTFSTFAVQFWHRTAAGASDTAVIYATTSVLVGIAAAALGFRLGALAARKRS
jgi:CrcB protein